MAQQWSLEAWCAQQAPVDWSRLDESSRVFLQSLELLAEHPFCQINPHEYLLNGIPPQGPLIGRDHLETWSDVAISLFYSVVPPLLAMGELWLRLFASLLAPLGIAHLVWTLLQPTTKRNRNVLAIICLLTLASSLVLWTDTLYVLEWGPNYGASLLGLSTLLVWLVAQRYQLRSVQLVKLCLLLLTLFLMIDYETGQLHVGHGRDEAVHIEEGLYYNPHQSRAASIVEAWPLASRQYTVDHATRWMPTGDARTGLPFLLHKVSPPKWTRLWLPTFDGEVLAIDFTFPTSGHDPFKPLYLLLHGLNGGSAEEYVKDMAHRRVAEGSTVAVMIARGLMDLPIRGWDTFHGARVEDVQAAAVALRRGVAADQALVAVGYSMGAIILSNYVARAGTHCPLQAAVAISGGLDMRYEIDFARAQRLWQPILTQELRDTFVLGKWGERVRQRLSKEQMRSMLRAYHITDIDKTAVVAYNGFRDLVHYYTEMSALGDIPLEEHAKNSTSIGRIHNVSIPLCVIHALDDPLISWRTVAANQGLLHPDNLVRTGSGNLFLLLTKRGGHVGWPLGWLPFVDKWKWMNDAAKSFVDAVLAASPEQHESTRQ